MARTSRLRRLRAVLWHLEESEDGLSASELCKLLGVAGRTVRRDLLALRQAGYPLATVASRWHLVDGQVLPAPLAIDGAEQAAERDKVRTLEACRRARRPVEAMHWSPGPGGPERLRLEPLLLRHVEGSLFAVCREHPGGVLLAVAVERLASVHRMRGRFRRPTKEEIDAFVADQLQRESERELIRVVVQFAPEAAFQVLERVWHPSQRVRRERDGSAVVTLKVPGFSWARAWVMGFGARALVVSPPELVRQVHDELDAARGRYARALERVPQLDLFGMRK